MQFAWLDNFGERWLLLDGNVRYPARSWARKDDAIAELRKEGWTVKPLFKRLSRWSSKRKVRGYAMMRTVH